MDERTRAMRVAPIRPLLIKMATPNAVAFLVQSFVSMAEVWFISRLGTSALAAIALAFPLLMLTQMMSGGAIGGAVTSAVARAIGAGDLVRAERLLWHALVIMVLLAGFFLLLFLLLGSEFLALLGGQGEALDSAVSYCLVLFGGGIFIWAMSIMGAIFRGTGDMLFPARLMIAGALIQVALTGVLVTGAFGLPQLGIVGASISAVSTAALLSMLFLWRLIKGPQQLKLRLRGLQFSRDLFADIGQVALPASLSPLLTIATVLTLTALVGRFGEAALAGYGIGSRIEMLMIPLVFGLGAAMTTLVGVNRGAGDFERAEGIGWTGGMMAAILSGTVGVMLALTPQWWIPIFSTDPATFDAAKSYIQIAGPLFAFQGLGTALYFASQGASRMTWPIVATLLRVVLAVGGALLLAFTFNLGLNGIFIAAALGMVAYGGLIAVSLKMGAWR
jgi:putative MATE family efflux protein